MKNQMKGKKGITLIALVITIIVLLILAGVTIATLTGDNGLLQKATNAKETSTNGEIEEEIKLAWNKVYSDYYLDNSQTKAERLEKELSNNAKVTEVGNKLNISNYKNINKTFILDIEKGSLDVKQPSTVEQAITNGTIFNEKNTQLTDEYENTVVIPKGFKLSKDSADVVTEGIVIEDATYTDTIGSQFVWIPVSKDNNEENKIKGATKNTTILLSRYKFGTNGVPDDKEASTIDNYFTELSNSSYRNAVAKTDVKSANGFIAKTNAAGGFWIGRYEARTTSSTARSSHIDPLTAVTEKPEYAVYNYIRQPDASAKARTMYEEENYFESDFTNSYEWDTAILFLQEYDNREGTNLTPYSRQNSINTGSLLETGTVSESNKDKICNVYDMASNCFEWTTETSSSSNGPCVGRGGLFSRSDVYTSFRYSDDSSFAHGSYSFRPILYIK